LSPKRRSDERALIENAAGTEAICAGSITPAKNVTSESGVVPIIGSRQSRSRTARRAASGVAAVCSAAFAANVLSEVAAAQTYGFATLPPGTLNHTTASAVAKVLKEKGGLNVLVQPTAGDQVIIPMVNSGEAEIGISSAIELHNAFEGGPGTPGKLSELRLIATAHPLRTAFFVRKDSPMKTIADLKGKKVVMGYSAMRVLDGLSRAILATGGLTEKDIQPVLVPNVIRGADDFVAGAADTFFFAFGAPKIREVDATVGGIRVLEVSESGMPEARKISPWGYLSDATPGPVFVGLERPMKVYTYDNVLFTNSRVPDDFVYKFLETLEKNKDDLVAVQPVLREFSAAAGYKKYAVPYHPGALKYFKERDLKPREVM
jgi:TRAP transporter TAXI family solute receptor